MRRRCLDVLHQMALTDPRLVYIGSDPGADTMAGMARDLPERCLIEGIAEANIIGLAAGMAFDGFIPYVNTIATFLTRRCFEQVAVDACLHGLPLRLIANGGGLVYAPLGPTHTAIEDIAIMRALPGMTVVCPADTVEMAAFMRTTPDWSGPIYIRVAKGGDPIITGAEDGFAIGKAILKRPAGEVLIVSTGVLTARALAAAELLAAEGLACGVLHVPTVKPLDVETLAAAAGSVALVVTVEEHLRHGGLGSATLEALTDRRGARSPRIVRLGLDDAFVHHYGSQDELLALFGLDVPGIAASIRQAARPAPEGSK